MSAGDFGGLGGPSPLGEAVPAPAAEPAGRDGVLPAWAAERAAGWDVFALERAGFAGGGRLAAAWRRVLGAPELGRRGGPGRLRATAQPRGCCGGLWGAVGPPRLGMEGGFWCCWAVPAARARLGWGALVSPGAGEGSGRAGVSQREREAAAGPADVRGPRGGARGSPRHTWVQSRAWRRVAGAGMWLWGCETPRSGAQWEQDPAGSRSHALVNGAWTWHWGPWGPGVKGTPWSGSESSSRAGVAQQPWGAPCRGRRWPELGWGQAVGMGLCQAGVRPSGLLWEGKLRQGWGLG